MKVSIITTTYNSASTLSHTIESVMSQTFQDIDYWIIDGESTDDTLSIINRYAQKYEGKLHWISERDHGIYDAMNKGIQRCAGDVVGILNSDDFFSSRHVIETIVKDFTEHPDTEAIYGDVHFVYPNNLEKNIRYYSGRIFRPWLVRFGFIAPHPSFYIKKEVFSKHGSYSPNYKISGDFELIARLCYIHHIKTRYLHLDVVTMRIGGASTRNMKARIEGAKETLIACKRLGIYTNRFFISFKYIIKIMEVLIIRN